MLTIVIPEQEGFNPQTEEFISIKKQTLQLEHSLVSISKWESFWKKPFLAKNEKTIDEIIDYIKCMTINQDVPYSTYRTLPEDIIVKIKTYINEPMTATWFKKPEGGITGKSNEIVTTEIIYYWMICFNIPMECQKWHLNRLLTLIRVCETKSKSPKKMNKRQMLDQRRRLNEQRKQQLNTKG